MTQEDPTRSGPAIRVRGLSHTFKTRRGSVHALDQIDLEVPFGSVFGLLGPNGAGKTTFVRVATGQLRPSSGSVQVAGQDVVTQRRRLHREIGVVFDQPSLYKELTGRQNLRWFASLYGIDPQVADRFLHRVGLSEAADRRVSGYSKGMKQRLALARALVHGPRVLFLDEPTVGLDPASSSAMESLIREEADRGAAVCLTTHDMDLAERLCDRVAILDRGRILVQGPPLALVSKDEEVMLQFEFTDGTKEVVPLSDRNRILELLSRAGLASLESKRRRLGDLFLDLTGRTLEGNDS